jgi:RNA polymerase sigma-70 factor (ECF subfamily)
MMPWRPKASYPARTREPFPPSRDCTDVGLETVQSGTTGDRATADELLAVRCQLGEPDAFDELIARWHEPLWRYARRITLDGSAADDVVQDVWMRVVRGISGLRDRTRLRSWVFGIAHRVLMDGLRARYAEPDAVAVEDVDLRADQDDSEDLRETLTAMHDELARLPLVEREVLVLFYLQELSLAELTEMLGVPIGTVKSRLFRARRLLRAQLAKRGITQ